MQMMQVQKPAPSARTAAREAFFLDFAREVRPRFPQVKLMVTGGFRSRAEMQASLAQNVCDMIGIGRPAVINQSLPKDVLLNLEVSEEEACMYLEQALLPWPLNWLPLKTVGAGAETGYYVRQISVLVNGESSKPPPGSQLF